LATARRFAADEQHHARGSAHATTQWSSTTERVIDIDSDLTTFTFVEAGSRWAAVARAGPVTITITATEIDHATIRLQAAQEPTKSLS
jgi:hypothetical protein